MYVCMYMYWLMSVKMYVKKLKSGGGGLDNLVEKKEKSMKIERAIKQRNMIIYPWWKF